MLFPKTDDKLDAVVIPLVIIIVAILVATVVILCLVVAHRTRKSRKLQVLDVELLTHTTKLTAVEREL